MFNRSLIQKFRYVAKEFATATRSSQEVVRDVKCHPRTTVCQREHVRELENWPFPAAGFTLDHSERREALHGESKEYEKCYRAGGAQILLDRLLQPFCRLITLDAVDGSKGSDDHLAGGKGGN